MIALSVVFLTTVFCPLTPAYAWKKVTIDGTVTNGNLMESGGGSTIKDSGISTVNLPAAADITAIGGDVDAFIGDITESYVVMSGATLVAFDTWEEHPAYSAGDFYVYVQNGHWRASVPGTIYTNPATSYLPPYDGWYESGTTNLATGVTVEWFSGQDNIAPSRSWSAVSNTTTYVAELTWDATNKVFKVTETAQ